MKRKTTRFYFSLVFFVLVFAFISPAAGQGRGRGRGNGDKQTNRPVEHQENSEDITLNGEDIIVKFEGKTPHAKFFLNKYEDDERVFYKIMFKSLEELDASGKKASPSTHSFSGLESQGFSHTVDQESTDDGDRIKVTFTTKINISETSVTVIFHFYIFGYDYQTTISSQQAVDTTSTESGETKEEVSVLASDEVKFDAEIHNWPFINEDHKLALGVRLIAIHRIMETEVENNDQVTTTTQVQEVDSDTSEEPATNEEESYMILPQTAIADGEEVDIEREYKKTGKQDHIYLIFPSFDNELYYDPVLGIGDAQPEPSELLFIGGIAVITLLAIIVVYQRR